MAGRPLHTLIPAPLYVILDRIQGDKPTDLFFNVLADQAQMSGTTARFVGPFGVDCDIHTFATGKLTSLIESNVIGQN